MQIRESRNQEHRTQSSNLIVDLKLSVRTCLSRRMETTGVSCPRGEKSVDSFVYKVRSSNEGTKCSDNFIAPFGCVEEEEKEPWEFASLNEEDCRL